MEQVKTRRRWLRPPSPAMIVACVALFVALGGTSYAAIVLPASSVGTKQLKSSAVTSAKVKDNTLTGADINESTLAQVPSAATAGSATTATSADNATHATSADTAATAAPSGAAGGDLSGTYPSPTIAAGAVGTTKVGALPGAHVRMAGAVSVPTSTSTALTFNTVEFNVGGVYNPAQTDRLTAPVAGRYLIIGGAFWQTNATGYRKLFITRNGAALEATSTMGNSTEGPAQQVEAVRHLNAGDTIQIIAWQNSGSTLDASYWNPGVTVTMDWIAP